MIEVQSDQFRRQRHLSVPVPTRTSRRAVASIACGAAFFVPLASIAAVVLGVLAVRDTRSRHTLRGGRLAWAGVTLGVVFTLTQLGAAWLGYRTHHLVAHCPNEALTVGLTGNTSGFRAYFHGPGAAASDAEIRAFMTEVRTRYGGFIECRLAPDAQTPLLFPGTTGFQYIVRFTDDVRPAEASVAVGPDTRISWQASRLESIRIVDDEQGDLVFPAALGPTGSLTAVPTPSQGSTQP